MLGKGPGIPADMVFLDLEDAVAPKEKEAGATRWWPPSGTRMGDKVLCVRVNDWSTKWTAYDIMAVVGGAGPRLDEIMVPKVESAAEGGHGPAARPGGAGGGSPSATSGSGPDRDDPRPHQRGGDLRRLTCLETIIFGPADFAASMEMPVLTGGVQISDYPGDHFHYVFSKILMAGRANGLQVIDGPYLYIRDSDGFPTTASAPARSGTTGSGRSTPTR